MLPLKVLKKQPAYNLIAACLKNSKDLQHASPIFQASCHEADHPVGPLNAVSSYWRHRFETEGVPEPVESIEHIIAHVIGSSKEAELHEKEFDEAQLEKLKMLCNRRLMNRMPLEYITAREEEWNETKAKLTQSIFIPESQTVMLVDLLLKHIARSNSQVSTVLEIGCRSGATSLSLLRSCDSVHVIAIDTNIVACELTLYNAQNLKLESRLTVLHATLEEDGDIKITSNLSDNRTVNFQEDNFDFIISNPPSTPIDEIPKWQLEDLQTLRGGDDGLKMIRSLLLYASKGLTDDGIFLLEVFPTQPTNIQLITEKEYPTKLRFDHVYDDLSKDEQIVEITKIG